MIVVLELKASEAVRCIALDTSPGFVVKGLANMNKLRCLVVNRAKKNLYFGRPWYSLGWSWKYRGCFPSSLQYLYWKNYPYRCLPKTFEANNLVTLEMPRSNIEQLWEGEKVMKNLKYLDLSYSEMLRSLDLGMTPKLEWLSLSWCTKLVKLEGHGGCLKSLVYLNLDGCKRLKFTSFIKQLEYLEVLDIGHLDLNEFPEYIITEHSINSLRELDLSSNDNIEVASSIGKLHNLVSLHVIWCMNLKSVPGSICNLQHLTSLWLSYSSIEELPEDVGQLKCLEDLNLCRTYVKHLPVSICMLKRLKTLLVEGCQYLEKLPEDVGQLESLEILDLSFCYNLREIPNSICKLKCLKELSLLTCRLLEKLPEDVGQLESLEILDLQYCHNLKEIPNSICNLKCLKELQLRSTILRLEKLPEELGNLKCLQY